MKWRVKFRVSNKNWLPLSQHMVLIGEMIFLRCISSEESKQEKEGERERYKFVEARWGKKKKRN